MDGAARRNAAAASCPAADDLTGDSADTGCSAIPYGKCPEAFASKRLGALYSDRAADPAMHARIDMHREPCYNTVMIRKYDEAAGES